MTLLLLSFFYVEKKKFPQYELFPKLNKPHSRSTYTRPTLNKPQYRNKYFSYLHNTYTVFLPSTNHTTTKHTSFSASNKPHSHNTYPLFTSPTFHQPHSHTKQPFPYPQQHIVFSSPEQRTFPRYILSSHPQLITFPGYTRAYFSSHTEN